LECPILNPCSRSPLFDVNQFFEPDVNHAGHVLTKTMRKWGRTKTLKELLWRYRQFGGLTRTTNMRRAFA